METEEKKPETRPSEEGQKPKIIRNREVDKAAKSLADDYVLPIPPGKTLTYEQMQEYLALLTPSMWNHISCYLYRLKPKIRRQLRDPNAPNYIDVLGEPFTLDHLTTRHGGGKYQIQAVDTDGKKETNLLFKSYFEINDAIHPPILVFEELDIDAKENRSYVEWLKIKNILGPDGKVKAPDTAPPSASTNLSAKEVLDILNFAHKMSADQQSAFRAQFAPGDSLGKSVGDILLEKMRQDDPGKDWDRMMTFMEKLHKPDNSMGPVIQLLQSQITNAQEQRKTDMEMFKFMMESQRKESSPRSQFGEFREVISFAREILNVGGNGRRTGWDTGLEIARDVVLPGLTTLGNTIANIMALRSGAPPVPGAAPAGPRPSPVAFDPYRNPNAARQWAAQQPPQAPPQQPPQPQPQPQPAPGPAPAPPATDAEAQLMPQLMQFGGLIVNHLNAGTPGYDFADYATGLLGTGVHAQITAFGEDVLVSTMMKIPELAIFGEGRIKQFVHEFINYEEYMAGGHEEESDEEEQEPAPKFYKPPTPARESVVEAR